MNLLKCKIIDPEMRKRYGEVINLERTRARRLENLGKVRITTAIERKEDIARKYSNKVLTADESNETISYLTKKSYSKGKKKERIAWVQDYSKPNGGAELSNKYLVSVGEQLGFDIAAVTPANFSKGVLSEADLIIINNFFQFNSEQEKIIYRYIYEYRKPFVKYDHDLREFKRIQKSIQMFEIAKAVVFLSPMHKKYAVEIMGDKDTFYTCPVAIDTSVYKIDDSIEREKDTVIVPNFNKCLENVKQYIKENPDKKYTVITNDNSIAVNSSNVKCMTTQSPEKMAPLYNQHEYMLHLPMSKWAGERIYFESMLCGCKPIINDNVGHASWQNLQNVNREALVNFLNTGCSTFWEIIEKIIYHI